MPLVDSIRMDRLHAADEANERKDAPAVPDLAKDQAELFRRAAVLPAKDRLLLELALKNRLSVRTIARVTHCPAGTICRRVQRIVARLRDPMIAALLDPKCELAPVYRQLAVEYFAQRQTAAQLADLHRLTRQQVREMLTFVRGWYRGMHLPHRGGASGRRR